MKKLSNLIILSLILTSFNIILSQSNWTDQYIVPGNTRLFSVTAININVCWTCGDSGKVYYTSNGGNNWIQVGNPPQWNFETAYVVAGRDSLTAMIGVNGSTGRIFRTTNKGQLWTQVFNQNGSFVNDIKFYNANTGYMYGDPVAGRWAIFKTTNNGITWDSAGLRLPGNNVVGWWNAMEVINLTGQAQIWFGTGNGFVNYSSNSGISWIQQPTSGTQNVFGITFMNITSGFCVGSIFFSSVNAGFIWDPHSNYPGSGDYHGVASKNGNIWYIRGNQIYYSTNMGTSWVMQHQSPLSLPFNHISMAYSATDAPSPFLTGWAVTGDGVISHYTDPTIGIKQISSNVPKEFSLSQNYPNPFNPNTKIQFSIPSSLSFGEGQSVRTPSERVRLIVFDILGREVAVLVNEQLKPGTYEVNWDAKDKPSGIYFYRITVNNFSDSKKMSLVK